MELYKWTSTKNTYNLDIVLAGLMTTSRSEHALHSSSLFLIDFLLGTSRGASLFTVASPQQNRAASWRLISWSAGQAQQKMFDQPEFDYVPQFNFNYLNYPINRKDWIQMVSKWFDDKTGIWNIRNQTTAKSTTPYRTHMQPSDWYRFDGYLSVAFVIVMPSPNLL